MKKNKYLKIILLIIMALLIIPYLKVETLTLLHSSKFTMEYEQTQMLSGVDYLKVWNYDSSNAKVLYITKGDTEDMLTFKKEDGKWIMINWETIWSTTGSADNIIYPFYW